MKKRLNRDVVDETAENLLNCIACETEWKE